jgi:hypothetical protein
MLALKSHRDTRVLKVTAHPKLLTKEEKASERRI